MFTTSETRDVRYPIVDCSPSSPSTQIANHQGLSLCTYLSDGLLVTRPKIGLRQDVSSAIPSASSSAPDGSSPLNSANSDSKTVAFMALPGPVGTDASESNFKSPSSPGNLTVGQIVGIVLVIIIWVGLSTYWILHCKKRVNRRRKDVESQLRPTPIPLSLLKAKSSTSQPAELNSRQEYLHNQMRAMLKQLEAAQGAIGESNAGLTRENEELRARIQTLEQQLQSQWALGLSDEPPPGYLE
ncbi:F-box domain-containing protein [Mycena venus]|uniref:F-box domain-containing protein n=1 Tax=Mycena venus TaxID=2733690 RepID=A0A8H7CXM0_9AGAR|nr:F-box domain-containing protein [Mycena venus]